MRSLFQSKLWDKIVICALKVCLGTSLVILSFYIGNSFALAMSVLGASIIFFLAVLDLERLIKNRKDWR